MKGIKIFVILTSLAFVSITHSVFAQVPIDDTCKISPSLKVTPDFLIIPPGTHYPDTPDNLVSPSDIIPKTTVSGNFKANSKCTGPFTAHLFDGIPDGEPPEPPVILNTTTLDPSYSFSKDFDNDLQNLGNRSFYLSVVDACGYSNNVTAYNVTVDGQQMSHEHFAYIKKYRRPSNIKISDGSKTQYNSNNLLVLPAPSIVSVTTTSQGNQVTVKGSGFSDTGNSVQFIDAIYSTEVVEVTNIPSNDSGTTLTVTIPRLTSSGLYSSIKVRASGSKCKVDTYSEWSNSFPLLKKKIVTIGGIHSTLADPIFNFIENIAPGSSKIALGSTSVAHNNTVVRNKINEELTAGNKVIVFAYSLGSVIAYNLRGEFTGKPVEFMYIDPPYLPVLCNIPGSTIFDTTLRAICRAYKNGIVTDRNTINWTNGTGKGKNHEPWTFPQYQANSEKLLVLKDKIQIRLSNP